MSTLGEPPGPPPSQAPDQKDAAGSDGDPQSLPQSLIGRTIAGRYRVESLLGEGGMGAVYLVQHTGIRKRLALKLVRQSLMRIPAVVARFEREAMASAHMDHPNVAAASDFGRTEDGRFYLALEYVEGQELRDVLAKAGGPLPISRTFYIARQITAALTRAHDLGIVHRDLKPDIKRADPQTESLVK